MDEPSDDQLMARIAGGDRPAFDWLVNRHLPRCLRLAERIVGSRADAEEVAQEFFLKVWTGAQRWRPAGAGGARFTTWLYRVVVNLCLDRRRRPAFASLDSAGDPADPADSAFTAVHKGRTAARVAAAVAALPERQRAALYLDNARSIGPGSPGGRRFGKGLNENYARELLELHTLGVDSGYGQADVQELAKILTGWSVARRIEWAARLARRVDPAASPEGLARETIGPLAGPDTLNAVARASDRREAIALLLASPEFQRR